MKLRDQIKVMPTSNLIMYARNNKKHPEQQIELLASNIKEFGFTQPILIDKDNNIIAGHGRFLAAKKLGMTELPCILIDDLSETQIKALRISDNRLSELADTDWEMLKIEMEELKDLDFDVDLTGFNFDDIESNLPEDLTQPEVQEDDFEPPKEAKYEVKEGDIWQLGEHRLMCGDSTDYARVCELTENEKVDMVFTDPPYNTGMSAKTNNGSTRLNHMFDDSYSDDEWDKFMSLFCANYYKILKEDSVAYICLDWRRSYELIPKIKEAEFKLSNVIVWDKVVHGLGSDYKYTYELIHVCKKGKPEMQTHQGEQEYSDVWHIQRKMGKDEDHATKKPIEVCARAIRHNPKSKTVLDLFGGSGSTMMACEQLNRKCYMMELDPYYCSVIIERWEKLTGNKGEKL